MAGKITEGRRTPEYVQGKVNEVISVTEVKVLAVAFADGESRRSTALVMVFGKDAEDGGAGVFTMADENQMAEQLKIASASIKKGVRSWLSGAKPLEDVPATVKTTVKKPRGALSGTDVGGDE